MLPGRKAAKASVTFAGRRKVVKKSVPIAMPIDEDSNDTAYMRRGLTGAATAPSSPMPRVGFLR